MELDSGAIDADAIATLKSMLLAHMQKTDPSVTLDDIAIDVHTQKGGGDRRRVSDRPVIRVTVLNTPDSKLDHHGIADGVVSAFQAHTHTRSPARTLAHTHVL